MKTQSFASKPWWPRDHACRPAPRQGAPLADRHAVFRHQVALAARRLGFPASVQCYIVAAVDSQPPTKIRPDLARQAREWAAHHGRCLHRRPVGRPRKGPPRPPRSVAPGLPRVSFDTLSREVLVLHWRNHEHQTIRQIAARLDTTPETVRQICARATTRIRQAGSRLVLIMRPFFDATPRPPKHTPRTKAKGPRLTQ